MLEVSRQCHVIPIRDHVKVAYILTHTASVGNLGYSSFRLIFADEGSGSTPTMNSYILVRLSGFYVTNLDCNHNSLEFTLLSRPSMR
ncbi:hypothetical protein OUZ56_005961 [Daphnia magna]|uniref:Uncharacterized protein n=1 Tax=Daphnia magna TaxID=35525 RepID=A0ABQ9YU98_9CRUS|nr:hypothetical protein OUZ56_005961 [Daphnia magna]